MPRAPGHPSHLRAPSALAVVVPAVLAAGLLLAFSWGDRLVEDMHARHVIDRAEAVVHVHLVGAVEQGRTLDVGHAAPDGLALEAVEARSADGRRVVPSADPSRVAPDPQVLREVMRDGQARLVDLAPSGDPDGRQLPRSVLVPVDGVEGHGTVVFQVDHDAVALAAAVAADARTARGVTTAMAGLALVALLGGWVAVAARYRRDARRAAALALRDDLTGLPNRRALHSVLGSLTAEDTPFSVIAADLTRLKEVNDTLGHEAGDQLIAEAAARLRIAANALGRVHRLGGDEFTIVVPHGRATDPLQVLRRISTAFATPFLLHDIRVDVGVSLGLARFPEDGRNASDLLRRADSAMYAAKRDGVGVRTYTEDLDRVHQDRVTLGNALRRSIAGHTLEVVYQPLVDSSRRMPLRVEALARWTHDGRPVPPSRFIPLVEDLGMGGLLTDLMLREVLAQQAAWRDEGLDIAVSINIFPGDVIDSGLPARVATLLGAHDLDPEQLTLEVTERAAVVRTARAADVMGRLRAAGVRFAIDDFGTGAWSLSHLKGLPVDCLKLDRSMIAALPDDEVATALVESVTSLAHRLGMHVVAEGIETPLQSACTRALGVDALQGHGLHRPMAACEVADLFRQPAAAALGVGAER